MARRDYLAGFQTFEYKSAYKVDLLTCDYINTLTTYHAMFHIICYVFTRSRKATAFGDLLIVRSAPQLTAMGEYIFPKLFLFHAHGQPSFSSTSSDEYLNKKNTPDVIIKSFSPHLMKP